MENSNRAKAVGCLVLVVAIVSGMLFCLAPQKAIAFEWPKHLVFAAPSAGTTNYMVAVGMGEMIKKYSPVKKVVVQPLGGPTVWGPMMKKGEVDFAIQSGANTVELFLGIGEFAEMGPMPVRTVIAGHIFPLMFHTTPAKNIHSIKDLKGKAVYTTMMGQPMFLQIAKAQLASAGLSIDDLKASMTMPSVAQATSDLIEGRIDSFIYPVVPSKVNEINHAAGECLFINLTEAQAEEIEKNNPGYFKAIVPPGTVANKEEMRWAICFQTCLHCRADLDPELVYEIAKILFDHHDEWASVHPAAKKWALDQKPVSTATEPYHKGAIKYYKEKNIWTDNVEKYDDALFDRLKKAK